MYKTYKKSSQTKFKHGGEEGGMNSHLLAGQILTLASAGTEKSVLLSEVTPGTLTTFQGRNHALK